MNTTNLDSFIAVPLPVDLYAEFTRRYSGGISSVLEQVAWNFLDRTADDFEAMPHKGVYWESLFLPEGTEIRTKYFHEYKTASIHDERIVWEGNNYPSFSKLANAMRGGTSNNAWNVLEIKRPSDSKWQLANVMRKK